MVKVMAIFGCAMVMAACNNGDGPVSDANHVESALSGELGDVKVSESDKVIGELYTESGFTELYLVAEYADGGPIMAGVYLGTDLSNLEIGTMVKYSDANIFEDETPLYEIEDPAGQVAGTVEGDGYGCSGGTVSEWEIDEAATDVEIEIVEGEEPGDVAAEFKMEFASGQVLRGVAALN